MAFGSQFRIIARGKIGRRISHYLAAAIGQRSYGVTEELSRRIWYGDFVLTLERSHLEGIMQPLQCSA